MRVHWASLALAVLGAVAAPAAAQEPIVRLPQFDTTGNVTVQPVSFVSADCVASQPTSCATGAVSSCDQGDSCCRGMYFQADALYWDRVGLGCNQVLVIDTNQAPGLDTLLQTSDLHFQGEPGMRFLVGWTPDCCSRCSAWELSYFGVFDWAASSTVTGPGNLAIPGQLGLDSNNFFLADVIGVRYTSDLNNVELNCVKSCCASCDTQIDFLCGFRYLNLHEKFSIVGTDLQEGTSSYDTTANNNLLGLQFGGRLRRNWCRCSLELTGKAGVFLNIADQNQLVTDFPNTPSAFVLRDASASGESVATVAEFEVNLVRQITDVWSLRVGYDALGVGGVALAPDQLDFTDTFLSGTTLNKDGYAFIHGGHLGVEARW